MLGSLFCIYIFSWNVVLGICLGIWHQKLEVQLKSADMAWNIAAICCISRIWTATEEEGCWTSISSRGQWGDLFTEVKQKIIMKCRTCCCYYASCSIYNYIVVFDAFCWDCEIYPPLKIYLCKDFICFLWLFWFINFVHALPLNCFCSYMVNQAGHFIASVYLKPGRI